MRSTVNNYEHKILSNDNLIVYFHKHVSIRSSTINVAMPILKLLL